MNPSGSTSQLIRIQRVYVLLYALRVCAASLSMGTYATFLRAHGLSLFELSMVNWVFWTLNFVLEVPTGALADMVGRKKCFVASCLISACAMFIYSSATHISGFVLAEAVAAVGTSLTSGAFISWVKDRLAEEGYDGSITFLQRRAQTWGWSGSIVSGVFGAWVGTYNLSTVWLIEGVILLLVSMLAVVLMDEVQSAPRSSGLHRNAQQFRDTMVAGFRYAVNHSVIRMIFAIALVLSMAVMTPNMHWQTLFSSILPDPKKIGVLAHGFIGAGMMTFLALGAKLGSLIDRKGSDERSMLFVCLAITGVGLVGTILLHPWWLGLSSFLLHEIGRGMYQPFNEGYLNRHIANKEERATVNSVVALSRHLGGMLGLPLGGWLAQHASLPTAWLVSGAGLLLALVLIIRFQPSDKP